MYKIAVYTLLNGGITLQHFRNGDITKQYIHTVAL